MKRSVRAFSAHSTGFAWRIAAAGACLAALASPPASGLLPLEGVAKVAAGNAHACALTTAGGVKCWGDNYRAQLGDGSTLSSGTPVEVTGLDGGVAGVSAGERHSCALMTTGSVKCWGANDSGQLGDGTLTSREAPVNVSGLSSGVVALSVGKNHACAVITSGTVKCWGANAKGALGDGSFVSRSTPVDVAGLAGVVAVAAGGIVDGHTCALTAAGGVKCWGDNTNGQLGDGSTIYRLAPVDVSGLSSGVRAIAAGSAHTCAVMASGGIKCWGRNFEGQLGDPGDRGPRPFPVDVPGLEGVVFSMVSAGGEHTCALTSGGGAKCWGGNYYGQVAADSAGVVSPTDVPGLSSGVAWVAAGAFFSCAVTTDGRARCWGDPSSGQLGDGFFRGRGPADVTGLASGVMAISAGLNHTCAITSSGGAKCWGLNSEGQVGDGSRVVRPAPVDVSGLGGGVNSIAAGGVHTCALTAAGGVKCWGENASGQLGNGTSTSSAVPVDVSGLTGGVTAITAGLFHTCALTSGGGAKCWGGDSVGQLGAGLLADSPVPVDVAGLSGGVVGIVAGLTHTCAVTAAGGVKCWGSNFAGQVDGAPGPDVRTPVDVPGLTSGVTAITAGTAHTCALTSSGGVRCWGTNSQGQLGSGSSSPAPSDVLGLSTGVVAVTAGSDHTCALVGGVVKCWGSNVDGELGFDTGGSPVAVPVPLRVPELPVSVSTIDAGGQHCCAIQAGAARCWGTNRFGQLGDAQALQRYVQFEATRIISSPSATSNATSPSFVFIATLPGPVECSLDGAPFAACTSPRAYSGLAPGIHSFQVRARDSLGNPDPNPPSRIWTIATPLLNASPTSLDFGGHSINTTSPPVIVTLTNPSASPITITSLIATFGFDVLATNCSTVPSGGTCQVTLAFAPRSEGATLGTVVAVYAGGATVVDVLGIGERSFVTHYYRSILRRDPDVGGRAYWTNEGIRVAALGASPQEVAFAMAQQFFASGEYAAANRDDSGFVTDLYVTFFNRAPDPGGLAFWTAQIASGLPREVALAGFMFSAEFRAFTDFTFGFSPVRPEIDMVIDFYRGLLGRLPDDAGFGYWLGRFRAAQCVGAGAVTLAVEEISSAFTQSGEYSSRARNNTQYVADLYNAFLRRGGDLAGVQFWISQIGSGLRSRENVRIEFKNSPEFQARVNAVIAQGCLQ